MNTRQAIQPSNTPTVLSISYSASRKRFATALSEGFRTYRLDNCLLAYQPSLSINSAATIAEPLDDRYCAFVFKHKSKNAGPNVVVFWDAILERELSSFDLHEPILGVRLTSKWMAVILEQRTVLFQYQELQSRAGSHAEHDDSSSEQTEIEPLEPIRAPNLAHSIYPTSINTFAVASLSNELLVLPAQSIGQVQLITLKSESGAACTKRVLKAHNSALRCIALSPDGSLLATTSQHGTLIRVFSTQTTERIAEFRRGMDPSIIYSLAFSIGNRFVASTSDKGTLHVYDIRPSIPAPPTAERAPPAKARPKHPAYPIHRIAAGAGLDRDSQSGVSLGRSSPAPSITVGGHGYGYHSPGYGYHGSVQEYYGLRPPPVAASPPARDAAVSTMAALKAHSLMPQAVRDVRSVASAPFFIGNDPAHWQGGVAHSWTTAPNGTKKRVTNPVSSLPNDPSGKPPKGIITFDPTASETNDDAGAVIYVIGGGSDARWEKFELLPSASGDGTWTLVNRGFRNYLTRQFAD